MPGRAVMWTLAILAAVLVVIPLLGMLGMTGWGGGMMGAGGMMGGNMMGMHAVGIIWMLGAAAVVIALIVLLVRGITRA